MFEHILFSISMIVIAAIGFLLYKLRLGDAGDRRMQGFYPMSVAALVWVASAAVKLFVAPEYFAAISIIKLMMVTIVSYSCFWFILNFTESKLAKSRLLRNVLIIVPALDILALLTTPLHWLYYTSFERPDQNPGTGLPVGVLFWIHLAALVIGSLFFYSLLMRYIIKNYRQYPLLIFTGVGVLIPVFLNIAWVINLFGIGYDFSPMGFFFTVFLFAYYSYASKARASRENRYSDTLGRITKSPVLSAGDFEEAAMIIAKEGCGALSSQCISIWRFTDDMTTIKRIVSYETGNVKSMISDTIDMVNNAEYLETLLSERLFVINDVSVANTRTVAINERESSLCAYMDAPIRTGGKLYGVISVEQHRCEAFPQKREWTAEEQSFASSLADLMVIAIESAERKTLIRRTETMMSNLPGMVYQVRCTPNGVVFTFVSEGSKALIGYRPDELVGNDAGLLLEMIHPDDLDLFEEHRHALLVENRQLETIIRLVMKDGSEKWICKYSRIVERNTDGTPYLLEGFVMDITEQRRLEMTKKENEHFKIMLNAVPLISDIWSRDYRVLDCNDEALRVYGLDKTEYIKRVDELVPEYQPDGRLSADMARGMIDKAFKDGKCVFESYSQRLDGTVIPMDVTLTRVKHGDDFVVVGYGRDLREHKKIMGEIEYKDKLLETVNYVSTILLETDNENFDGSLRTAMGIIGKAVDVTCVYVRKNNMVDGVLCASQVCEWVEEAAELTMNMELFINIPYIGNWEEDLLAGKCINSLTRDMTPEQQEQVASYGVLSLLNVPIFLRGELWGVVGFDDCRNERIFTEDEEMILRSASRIIANALIRGQAVIKIDQQNEVLKIVNSVSTILLEPNISNFEKDLFAAMGMMAKAVDVDRVYVWKNHMIGDRLYCTQIYEWSERAEPQQGNEHTVDIPYDEVAPSWQIALPRGECVNAIVRELPLAEQAHLASQGILSILAVPVFLHDEFWGFVGFDDCRNERVFTENEEFVLRSASRMIANSLIRKEMLLEIDRQNKVLETVNRVSTILLEPNISNFENDLFSAMDIMAKAVNADRVYIYKNHVKDGRLHCSQVYEWSEGAQPQEGGGYSADIPYDEGSPNWYDNLSQGKSVSGIVREMHPYEQELLSSQGIISVLVVPIFLHDEFWGFAGFDDCRKERIFNENDELILRSASRMVANALIRKEMTQDILDTSTKLRALNEMSIRFLSLDDEAFEDKMTEGVRLIADNMGIDRLSVWHNHRKHGVRYTSQIYRWDKESGGTTPPDPALVDIPFSHISSNLGKLLEDEASLNGPVSLIEETSIAQMMKEFGVVSAFTIAINLSDSSWGFVLFEDRRNERTFDSGAVEEMRAAAHLCVNTIRRREMERKLEAALYDATAASKAKSEFLAKMSHEIRTPMNAIIGMTELALRNEMTGAVRKHATAVKQAGVNLLSIINDVLDMSKIESGNLQIIPARYSLSSLINDVINIIGIRAVDSRLHFVVNLDSNLPDALIGDEPRIRQILINLLGNAVKYTDEGFVSFTVYGEAAGENAINLIMEVKDSGRGVKEEDIEKLFHNFFQLDTGSSKRIEGVGLGLPITWSIVKAMDGEITVESEYGKGSTFTVTLPQKIISSGKLAQIEHPDNKKAILYERREICAKSIIYAINNLGVKCELASDDGMFSEMMEKDTYSHIFIPYALFEKSRDLISGHGGNSQVVLLADFGESIPAGNWGVLSMPVSALSVANIFNDKYESFSCGEREDKDVRFTASDAKALVVDDIEVNLIVASGLLAPYNMQVDTCWSGEEAIEAVKAKRYDIIFMDHRMPGMDGVETVRHIRALGDEDNYYKNVPVVALTADAVSGMKEMFLQNGFDDFLSKPMDTVRLNSVLERLIKKDKQRSSAVKSVEAADAHKLSLAGFSAKGLDTGKGVRLTGGTAGHYHKALAAFFEDAPERKEKIVECFASGDLYLYTIHVHALKGASASIGADRLSETAAALETAGLRGNLAYIEAHNGEFLAELEGIRAVIGEALASYGANGGEAGSVDTELFNAGLVKLKAALNTMDVGEINRTIDNLSGFAYANDVKDVIRKISKHILMFEYDEAVKLIDYLLQ